jgi:hypothetical protein
LEQVDPGLGGVEEKAGNEERTKRSISPKTHFFIRKTIPISTLGKV